MVRPGRDQLSGLVEVDETYVGGPEERMGRGAEKKTLVVIAVEKRGRAFGRTRMAVIEDASADALCGFVERCVAPGSTVRTDGWPSYGALKDRGYTHDRVVQRNNPQTPIQLLPGVHLVASLLKRWLLGTHQGAVSPSHLPYYLDEFTFRFNRRTSKARGLLFYRLVEQAVAVHPISYKGLIEPKPQPVGLLEGSGYLFEVISYPPASPSMEAVKWRWIRAFASVVVRRARLGSIGSWMITAR